MLQICCLEIIAVCLHIIPQSRKRKYYVSQLVVTKIVYEVESKTYTLNWGNLKNELYGPRDQIMLRCRERLYISSKPILLKKKYNHKKGNKITFSHFMASKVH